MKKTRKRIVTWLLCLSMMTTLFAAVPAKAAEEEEGDYGLLVAEWIEGDEEGSMIVTDKGFPGHYEWGEDGPECDAAGNPIIYPIPLVGAWTGDASNGYLNGKRFYFVYKESADAEPVPVKAEDLELRYYTISEGNWYYDDDGYLNTNNYVTGKGLLIDDPDQETWKGVVDFFPDDSYVPSDEEITYYVCVYKGSNKAVDAFPIRAYYPEIGFYSAPEQTRENLVLDEFDGNGGSYCLYRGDGIDREVYMHLSDQITLAGDSEDNYEKRPSFELELWEGPYLNSNDDNFDDYMTVQELNNGWYKLNFAEEMIIPADPENDDSEERVADGFNLNVHAVVTDGDDQWYTDAWLGCEYRGFAPGLYAQVEGFDDINAEGVDTAYLEATPYFFRMFLGQSSLEDGAPKRDKFTAEELKNLKLIVQKSDSYNEEEGYPTDWDGKPAEWKTAVAGEDYNCTLDGDYVKFESYYQCYYRLSVEGIDGAVLIHAGMNALAFFNSNKRPADEERIENRIGEITVDEGKTDTVYMLAWVNPEEPWAPNLETLKITAKVDGKEVPSYIDATKVIKDENGNTCGCEVKITDQAKENFTIIATVKVNAADEIDPNYNTHREELTVTINKIKELKIATAPTKTTYTEGESFDAKGMVVKAVYEDGKEEMITNYTVTPSAALKATDTSVTVSYLGKTVAQKITVNAKQPNTTDVPAAEKKGTSLKDDKSKSSYKVTSSDAKAPTVAYKASTDKKAKSVTIPDTVTVDGVSYKVTSIDDNAFKGNKTITKVTVGKNIKTIGKNAFSGCKKLKTVTIGKNVTTLGASAFNGCSSMTKLALPAKLNNIGKNAFNGCKKIKTLTISSKDLTSKSVSNGAFKGLTNNTTVKVPKGKASTYKKLLKKKGLTSKAKVK